MTSVVGFNKFVNIKREREKKNRQNMDHTLLNWQFLNFH